MFVLGSHCFPWMFMCVHSSACLRSFLACLLCFDCQNPLHPQDLDIPLSSSSSTARPSLTALQGAVERPQTTLPFPSNPLAPLDHWTMAVRVPVGVEEVTGDGVSIAGLSCGTLTPSERTDMRQLLQTPRMQHQAPGSLCPSVVSYLRRINLRTWYDFSAFNSRTLYFSLVWSFLRPYRVTKTQNS